MAVEPGKWAGGGGGEGAEPIIVEEGGDGGNGKNRFHKYKSILNWLDTSQNDQTSDFYGTDNSPKNHQVPPWRQYIGRVFLDFPSPIAEYTPEKEWEEYCSILKSTFSRFSDIPVGSDIEVIDLSTPKSPIKTYDAEMTFEIDINPTRGIVGMEDEGGDVLYDEPIREAASGEQGRSNNQTCWNCLSTGHSYMACPNPKNHMMIRHSRDTFLFQRDYVMPEYIQPALDMYWSMNVTLEEMQRRSELVDQFGLPSGRISEELQEAICFVPEDQDGEGEGYLMREKMEVKRRRKRWDWYEGIMMWGYPPGWIAGKDPVQEIRRRIESLEVHEKAFDMNMDGDEDDQLEVFGGNLGTPSPAASEDDEGSSFENNSQPNEALSSDNHTDGQSEVGESDMEMDVDHDNEEDSVPTRLEKVKRLSINGFQPPLPISHPVKSPSPPFRPPTPPLPPPPPPPGRDVNLSPRPPTPPLPPPPLPEDDIPPPPPDDIAPPPPAAPTSPTSHPNPFLRQYYALHTPISRNNPPPTGPRNQFPDGTPPTGPRNRYGTPQSHQQNDRHHLPSTNSLRVDRYSPHSRMHQTPSESLSLHRNPTIPHTPISTSPMQHAPKRWVRYHTDLFDSERLVPYHEGRPFPLGNY
ncbi:hypothetical protein I302_105783 [Kwoniella bestiolae CBS 10118]|uniref:CCHC-type domain-containing protein n=1 Tax=Kwoniella bestiolae CBS 10118 TaxID=1296100 RepID=A0A1B9G257_9TREE|nr:hypothetical protein I302_04905 [Kwoniella bestiolae CBS 10118]OCF25095.1 hypothetical protein I302_04905 [Kwoniella bestiolae CBS 10118]